VAAGDKFTRQTTAPIPNANVFDIDVNECSECGFINIQASHGSVRGFSNTDAYQGTQSFFLS
jgi:hypothetical protein